MEFPTLYTDCAAPSKERADFNLLTEKPIFNAQTNKDKGSILDKYNNRIRDFNESLGKFNHDNHYPKQSFFKPAEFGSFNKIMGLDATTTPADFEVERLKIFDMFDILNSDATPEKAAEVLLGRRREAPDMLLTPPLANSLYLPKPEKLLDFDLLFDCMKKDSDRTPIVMTPAKYLRALNMYTNNLTRGLLSLNSKIASKLDEKSIKELKELNEVINETEPEMEEIYEDKAIIAAYIFALNLPEVIKQFRDASKKGDVVIKARIGDSIKKFMDFRMGLDPDL
jgi:hypothetical protein